MKHATGLLKKMILTALCLALACALPASAAQWDPAAGGNGQQENMAAEKEFDIMTKGEISMEVTCGYDNAAKGDRYVPVEVTLNNQGEESFYGYLRLNSMESSGEIYQYRYEVSVEAGSAETFLYYVPLGSNSNQIFVYLQDSGENDLLQKRLRLDVNLDTPELFVGILSDTPEKLLYFNGIGVNYSMLRTRTFQMDSAAFPENKIGLNMLDVLVVSNYNLRELSEIQTGAIMDWVRSGGILMLGTGDGVDGTLGRFAPELLDDSYSSPQIRWVDMGLEYDASSPGDSMLQLSCVDVPMQGGNVLLADDGFPILTAVTREKGMVVAAAYDFCDISQFCQNQPSYIDEMFTILLGEEKLSQMSSYLYGGNNDYWSVQSMLNTGNVNRLPNVPLYVAVIVIYIILIGPGLYLFLKKKNRQQYFKTGVVVLSLGFTGIIWLMGSRTRFVSTFFTYATIQDVTEDVITESSYLNVRNPYNSPHSTDILSDYSVRPITKAAYYDMNQMPVFTGKEKADVELDIDSNETTIQVHDAVAFESNLFRLEKRSENTEQAGITGHINYFDGEVSGSITNQFDHALENVAIVLYGKILLLGELQEGETRDLAGAQVLNIPISDAYLQAQWISGNYQYETADISDEEYLQSMKKTNLLMFYMNNYLSGYHSEGRVVSFSTEKTEDKFFVEENSDTYGMTLLTSPIETSYEKGGKQYRSALMKQPRQVSGSYQASANSMYGMDPLTLEYYLGAELDIERLQFEWLSPEMLTASSASYIQEFSGNIYFYNYNTGVYDQMNMKTGSFTANQLTPYLSPGNTITVKYSNSGTSSYNWITLPTLSVIGREK